MVAYRIGGARRRMLERDNETSITANRILGTHLVLMLIEPSYLFDMIQHFLVDGRLIHEPMEVLIHRTRSALK